MERDVVYLPTAEADIKAIRGYLTSEAGRVIADNYVDRIIDACDALSLFPERGTRHDDVAPGLRSIGFARRVTIIFRVNPDRVEIVSIAYGGRNWQRTLRRDITNDN